MVTQSWQVGKADIGTEIVRGNVKFLLYVFDIKGKVLISLASKASCSTYERIGRWKWHDM